MKKLLEISIQSIFFSHDQSIKRTKSVLKASKIASIPSSLGLKQSKGHKVNLDKIYLYQHLNLICMAFSIPESFIKVITSGTTMNTLTKLRHIAMITTIFDTVT